MTSKAASIAQDSGRAHLIYRHRSHLLPASKTLPRKVSSIDYHAHLISQYHSCWDLRSGSHQVAEKFSFILETASRKLLTPGVRTHARAHAHVRAQRSTILLVYSKKVSFSLRRARFYCRNSHRKKQPAQCAEGVQAPSAQVSCSAARLLSGWSFRASGVAQMAFNQLGG